MTAYLIQYGNPLRNIGYPLHDIDLKSIRYGDLHNLFTQIITVMPMSFGGLRVSLLRNASRR